MIIYIVWQCDAAPYSDMQDWPIRAYKRLDKAEAMVKILDKEERKGLGKDDYVSNYHRITTLELEQE